MRHVVKFVPREGVDGQDAKCLEIMRKMLFTDEEIDHLFTSYCDIDADHSGLVSNDEFLLYFSMEKTPINTKIFGAFDRDGSGCISFFEFVCSVSDSRIYIYLCSGSYSAVHLLAL
jgi:Ca2+-binding EF-hand superfamily protein